MNNIFRVFPIFSGGLITPPTAVTRHRSNNNTRTNILQVGNTITPMMSFKRMNIPVKKDVFSNTFTYKS
ncbi:hypothetical protein D3C71_1246640 [compost metagenome]